MNQTEQIIRKKTKIADLCADVQFKPI